MDIEITYTTYQPLSNQTKEISELFRKTFGDSEGVEEGEVIASLAERLITKTPAEDIHVFIASSGERIVGCIILTRLRFEDETNAFIMGPVAVLTNLQGKRIGQNLITYGLGELRNKDVAFVITYGDINYYSQVGFEQITEETVPAPLKLSYPEGWLGLPLIGNEIKTISGKSQCVPEFDNPIYW